MRKVLAITLALCGLSLAAKNTVGFYTEGRHLYAKDGSKVILRGINHMATWVDSKGEKISEIEKTGANVVRIVWETGGSSVALDSLITKTINNKMIPMPELHDLTGKPLTEMATVVNYWIRPDVQKVLVRHQEYLLLNIGNEIHATEADSALYVNSYAKAIDTLRAHGIHVPLVIDADKYGQGIDILQKTGKVLIDKDPDQNLLFSIHLWWPYEYYAEPGKKIVAELQESVNAGIPLIIGEFAKISPSCNSTIPYDTIIAEAHKHEMGWLAWAWGPGNNGGDGKPCPTMDLTLDGNFSTLKAGWADSTIMTSPYSVNKTSVRPAFILNKDYTMGTITTTAGEELVINGTFNSSTDGWTKGFWSGTAAATVVNGQASINITVGGPENYSLQFNQGVALVSGKTYVFSFEAKANAARTIQALVKNPSPFTGYVNEVVDLTTTLKKYSFEFTMTETNAGAILSFDIGGQGAGTITLDNVSLVEKGGSTPVRVLDKQNKSWLRLENSGVQVYVQSGRYTLQLKDTQGRVIWNKTGTATESWMQIKSSEIPNGVSVMSLNQGSTSLNQLISKP